METTGFVELHLLAEMNPDEPADVAVARQHDGMAAREHVAQAVGDAAAERVEPVERRRALPRNENRDRRIGVAQIEMTQHGADRGGDRIGIDRSRPPAAGPAR